jgi:uncharacterized protein YbjT (DUF2867 family)
VNPFNLFYGLLWWKKQAEQVLQRSGLPYTIVRPGGLTATPKVRPPPAAIRHWATAVSQ